jgi:8-oxo-dGTP diphosphatase
VADFEIRVHVADDGIAIFEWEGPADPDTLIRAVSAAADDALVGRGLRRLEVALPVGDLSARRAVLRAGFRQEGIRREAHPLGDGSYVDIALFSRLAADQAHGPNAFSGVMNSVLPRKRVIAHVLIRAPAGRLLLCETQFKQDWELPGGIVEPGEPPRVGAAREVHEELGIELGIGRLLVADWMPPYLGWDDALELVFDGGELADADLGRLVLQPSEIRQARFVTLAEAQPLVTELSHRRLTVACGLSAGEAAYLENGVRSP